MSSTQFHIWTMTRHDDGFFIATVQSHYDQSVIYCHERWGSWMTGDWTVKGASQRDLIPALSAALASRKRQLLDEQEKLIKAGNPFVTAAIDNPNPFMR